MSFSASSDPAATRSDEQRRRGRRIALAILAICAAPTVAAWLAYFVWKPHSRTNYGELVAPRSLAGSSLRRLDGGPFRLSDLQGKWVLLQIDSAACGENCRRKLVYLRQARLALGKDADRIARLWILDDALVPDPALLRVHQGLLVARAPRGSLPGELPPGDPAAYIYVIDPHGNLMLRFPGDADGGKMVKDLGRLLRTSRIG